MSKQQDGNVETLRLFTWDGTRLIQEESAQHKYTYVYRDQGSFEPLAQVVEELNTEEPTQRKVYYYHTDQVGIPKEVTDAEGNLAWYGHYKAWGQLKEEHNLLNIHQPFRLQNQYFDAETGLHYNLLRYYDPHYGRFINQDPIGLMGGSNLYQFSPNAINWIDPLGLAKTRNQRLGDFGEKYFMDQLRASGKYSEVFSIQNDSNHGIDVVGIREEEMEDGTKISKCDSFEIKTNTTGKAGDLSERQAMGGKKFVDDIVLKAKDKGNNFNVTSKRLDAMGTRGNYYKVDIFVKAGEKGRWYVDKTVRGTW